MTHQTLSIRFPNAPLKTPDELRKFVNGLKGGSHKLLHNHRENFLEYPKVQFREIDGKSAIWAINEGIEAVEGIQLPPEYQERTYEIQNFELGKFLNFKKYSIKNILPFEEKNFKAWKNEISYLKRVELVENCLKSHIANFYENFGEKIPHHEVSLILNAMVRNKSPEIHVSDQNLHFLSFDCFFYTDLVLPDGLGLGKNKAKGYGICRIK